MSDYDSAMQGSPMTYRQALDWVYSFSDTERTGVFVRDRDDNLRRERALLAALGNPQQAYSIIHIAGSKGKGSTSAMLESIKRAAGVRTGLYTSPDLHTFRERIRIDGKPIAEAEMARLVGRVREAYDSLHAGVGTELGPYITWEIATALAFLAFREAGVREAIIEVGLGGRLDATNVVERPALNICAITSISYDHMAVLGNTLTDIAREKAGIIKSGVPVITSACAPEALAEITRVAAERKAPLLRVGPHGADDCQYTYTLGPVSETSQRFDMQTPQGVYRDLEIPLLGEHQAQNATLAVALALPADEQAIRDGLRQTRWQGRMQVVGREPWRIVDGAHNADSLRALFAGLRRHFTYHRLILVFGMMADKDLAGMLRELADARVDAVIATQARNPRAVDAATLQARVAEATSATAVAEPDVAAALAHALAMAGPRDLVCATGSLYLVAEALDWFAAQPDTPAGTIEIAGHDHG